MRGFEAGDAERAALEFLHFFAAGVGRMVRGDGVNDAADYALDDGFGIVLAAQRRLHFVIAVIGAEFCVGDGEMVRRDFAADFESARFRECHHRDGTSKWKDARRGNARR